MPLLNEEKEITRRNDKLASKAAGAPFVARRDELQLRDPAPRLTNTMTPLDCEVARARLALP